MLSYSLHHIHALFILPLDDDFSSVRLGVAKAVFSACISAYIW